MWQELEDCLREIRITMRAMRDYASDLETEEKLPTTREYTDLLVAKANILCALAAIKTSETPDERADRLLAEQIRMHEVDENGFYKHPQGTE